MAQVIHKMRHKYKNHKSIEGCTMIRIFHFNHYLHKVANSCQVYSISEDNDGIDYPNDRDFYDILNDVEKIFKQEGINIQRNEEFYEACIDATGKVHGASVVALDNGEIPTAKFSVAIDSSSQRQGIATRLVQSIMSEFRGSHQLEAWVVNPNMGALLEKLGFDEPIGGWSQNNPYYTLS